MRHRSRVLGLALAGASVSLTACSTPFAGSTAMDWSGKPAPGTISVSDPKEFRREALINERSKEVAWLNQQLDESRTIEFKPEIAREIETITALSGALGLSFDPASGLNYRRAKETGDLQQQMEALKLQFQLEQLKRDLEINRAKFEAQTEAVNADLGKLGPGGVTAATSGTSAASAEQLKAAIDRLLPALTSRLDADGKAVAMAATSTSPGDLFRDRQAQGDLVKTALNAASLDDLHDANGAALLRLNFHTTIFPDREKSRVPGVIQAKVIKRAIDMPEQERVYGGWLDYLNGELNVEDGAIWRANSELLKAAVVANFDVAEFEYPRPASLPAPEAKPVKPKKGAQAAPSAAPSCRGLLLDTLVAANPACARLVYAVPKLRGMSAQEGAYSNLGKYLDAFELATDEDADIAAFNKARGALLRRRGDLITNCGLPHPAEPGVTEPTVVDDLYLALETARIRVVGGAQLLLVDDLARTRLRSKNISAPADPRIALIAQRTRRADALLTDLENFAYAGCSVQQQRAYRDAVGKPFIPRTFADALSREGDVSIYEVGPRELVQQISTVARSANSLALALSVAASDPSSGAGANAAAGYSRQAMGRAAALERLPAVVGYSVRGQGTFGWVIGPRATLDPKGKLDLDQSLREYDLTVDLSVPAWWPSFDVETTTAWAPSSREIANGALSIPTTDTATGQRTTKPVRRVLNSADYAALTAQLASGGLPVPKRARLATAVLTGQAVNACRSSTLLVKGDNVWRANVVLINGYRLGATAISVAPDMAGVLVDVPALDEPLGDVSNAQVKLTVLTPFGDPSGMVDYVGKPAGGCKAAAKKPADGPSIADYGPRVIQVPAPLTFRIVGEKLDQVTSITLNSQAGALTVAKGGKSLTVAFTAEQTRGAPVSRTVPLTFFKADEKIDEKLVEVTANAGGN